MRVARLSVDGDLEFIDVANDVDGMHDALGGYMETIHLPPVLGARSLLGIVDEEGQLRELAFNPYSWLLGQPLVGPVLIVHADPPEFVSLTKQDEAAIRQWAGV